MTRFQGLAIVLWLVGSTAWAGDDDGRKGNVCLAAAGVLLDACKQEVRADFSTSTAGCIQADDRDDRKECLGEAEEARSEGQAECREQKVARRELCGELDEANGYDPDFDREFFDDDFTNLTRPNPFLPLRIGNRWRYAGGDETIEVEVLDQTKLIDEVTCIVVRDRVEVAGDVVEDTDDWFAQALDGSVWYCGEISKNFELFEGDDPEIPELVDVGGSWKSDRDGAQAGTLFLGTPAVGVTYRQEFAPGTAEDAATVLSTTYRYGRNAELDAFVPRALAERLCTSDCVVTAEFTPLSPDAFERKYYARGIGLFLEVDPEGGDVVQLVGCNFDARCGSLPQP